MQTTTYSKPFPITYGTAQGSCLGPLLFILFCNDIKLLPLYGTLILFADDTTLLNYHRNKNFLKFSIVHDLELLMDWFNANQFSLNLLKTVIINFWDDGKSNGVHIRGITIPAVENTKFLGVYLDYKITWTKQTDHLHKKLMANKMLLTNSRNLLSTYCLKSIYYAHIFSHLTYGLLIWGPMVPKKS